MTADRKAISDRIFAFSGMGVTRLAKKLGTTVATLDKLVCRPEAVQEAVYARVVPRLESLEEKMTAYKAAGAPLPQGTGAAALLGLLTADVNGGTP